MKDNDKIYDEIMCEMGRRVGLDWTSIEDAKAYGESHGSNWYSTRTWTREQCQDFKRWMSRYLKKNTNMSVYRIAREVEYWNLNYGWKEER